MWFRFNLQHRAEHKDTVADIMADLLAFHSEILVWLKLNQTRSSRQFYLALSGERISLNAIKPKHMVVKLRSKRDATLFKLFFGEWIISDEDLEKLRSKNPIYNKIILPLIRRSMPSLIAREIIGCHPIFNVRWHRKTKTQLRKDKKAEKLLRQRWISLEEKP